MQPVRIGLNASVVLLALLLSVPLQLLLSHLSPRPAKTPGERGEKGDVADHRTEAVEQLVDSAESFLDGLHSTLVYYSTWNHLKELVLVPYRRTPRTNLKSTVFKSKAGTTTILISSMNDQKGKKKSISSSSSSSATSSSGGGGGSSTRTGGSTSAMPNSKMTGKASKTTSESILNSHLHRSSSNTATAQGAQKNPSTSKTKKESLEEVSQAKEVEEYLMNEVYFATSKTPRKRRSSMAYSVGQVVEHRKTGYVGVIVGWDTIAKAPEKWIKHYYSNREGVELSTHYLVLVDSKYSASGSPYHYVPEEDLELVAAPQQLRCPEISEYFEGFKNGRHTPKPWLRDRYPKD